jgi:WD40 repeat protein
LQEEFKQNVPADMTLDEQVFYLDFHPSRPIFATSFLDGKISLFVFLRLIQLFSRKTLFEPLFLHFFVLPNFGADFDVPHSLMSRICRYEYSSDATKLVETFKPHTDACRSVKFAANGSRTVASRHRASLMH